MTRRTLSLLLMALAMLAPLSTQAAVHLDEPNTTTLSSGLFGYWPLDGNTLNWTTDSAADISGNSVNASMVSMSTTSSPIPGVIGGALNFNGSAYLQTSAFASIPSSITLSVWIKPNPAGGVVLDEQGTGGWHASQIEVETNNTIKVCVWTTGESCVTAATGITYGAWYQVVLDYNSSTQVLQSYVNGVSAASAPSIVKTYPTSGLNYGIGKADTTSGGVATAFSGRIDDVRFYARALSSQEVALLYALGTIHTGNTPAANSSFSIDQGGINGGLVGYWPLDGNTTNWATGITKDISGNGLNGQLIGLSTTTSPVPGKIGSALQFNGLSSNTYVTLGSSASLNPAQFTVSAWVKTSTTTYAYNWIFSNSRDCCGSPYNGFGLQISSIGTLVGVIWNSTQTNVNGVGVIRPNTWAYATFTYNGVVMKLYLNGKFDSLAVDVTGVGTPASFASTIGTMGFTPGQYTFMGDIDDVRLYNRALSAQEVANLYASGQVNVGHSNTTAGTGINAGLVGYWTFDGPSINWNADTVSDVSGNGNTGTLVSMSTTSSPTAGKIGQGLKFNGVNQYVTFPDISSSIGNNITTSFWIKANGSSFAQDTALITQEFTSGAIKFAVIGDSDNGGTATTVAAGFFTGSVWDTVNETGAFTFGKWTYVTASYDGSTLRLYINGVLNNTTSVSSSLSGNGSIWNIGKRWDTIALGNVFLNGSLDDVRVYNRTLSAQEIQQLYQMGR